MTRANSSASGRRPSSDAAAPRSDRDRFARLAQRATRRLVVLAALGALLAASCGRPGRIDHLTIVNRSEYNLAVDVRAASRGTAARRRQERWTRLTTVKRDSYETTEDIPDQGDAWIFRFRAGGVTAGELRVSRATLGADRWRIEVPARVAERLRGIGVPPSPRSEQRLTPSHAGARLAAVGDDD